MLTIIVLFAQRRRKEQLIAAMRARRRITTAAISMPGRASNLYVCNHLPPTNKLLPKRVRELKVVKNDTYYVWVKECKVNAVKITDLYKIK